MFARIDDIDRTDTGTLQVLWNRLSAMLEVHAEAEEVYFYPELLKLGERLKDGTEADETVDAIGDHNEIRDGIRAASLHDVGSNGWWQGVMAARKANDEHMGEEEHEGLRDFRRHIDLETRHKIAVRVHRLRGRALYRRADRRQGPEEIRRGQQLRLAPRCARRNRYYRR